MWTARYASYIVLMQRWTSTKIVRLDWKKNWLYQTWKYNIILHNSNKRKKGLYSVCWYSSLCLFYYLFICFLFNYSSIHRWFKLGVIQKWRHRKNTKFQSPIPPMSPLVTFFIIPPPLMSPGKWWQTFSLIKDLKNNSTCLV